MIRPRATAAASARWRRTELPPRTTDVGVGDTYAVSPAVLGDQAGAQGVVRVGDDDHPVEAPLLEQVGGARHRLRRGAPAALHGDRVGRDAAVDQVLRRRLRLGEAIVRLLAAGDDDQRRDAVARTA